MVAAGARQGRRLGELLLLAGFVTDFQLRQALDEQASAGGLLGDTLVRQGAVSEQDLVKTLSQQLGMPAADLTRFVPRTILSLVPGDLAALHEVLPLSLSHDGTLTVATSNPSDRSTLKEISSRTRCRIEAQIAGSSEIRAAIGRSYGIYLPPDPHTLSMPRGPRSEESSSQTAAPTRTSLPGAEPTAHRTPGPATTGSSRAVDMDRAITVLVELLVEKNVLDREECGALLPDRVPLTGPATESMREIDLESGDDEDGRVAAG